MGFQRNEVSKTNRFFTRAQCLADTTLNNEKRKKNFYCFEKYAHIVLVSRRYVRGIIPGQAATNWAKKYIPNSWLASLINLTD